MLDALQDEATPPDVRIRQRPQHGCTTVAAWANRRAHCAGVLLLVKEQRAGVLTRMPVHVWCMHHVLTTVPFTAGTQRQAANDWILCDFDGRDSVGGGFGTPSARAVRKKQCGSACVDHIVAIAHSSIAALWSTMRSTSMLAYSASL